MRIRKVLLVSSVLWLGGTCAQAGCPDPYKKPVEKLEDGSIQTNYFGEGYRMCIAPGFKPENGCGACVPGKLHICQAGGIWETRGEACGAPQGQQPPRKKPDEQLASADPATTASVQKNLDEKKPEVAKPQAVNSSKADLEAVYQRCKDVEGDVQGCIDRELAKQKKLQ